MSRVGPETQDMSLGPSAKPWTPGTHSGHGDLSLWSQVEKGVAAQAGPIRASLLDSCKRPASLLTEVVNFNPETVQPPGPPHLRGFTAKVRPNSQPVLWLWPWLSFLRLSLSLPLFLSVSLINLLINTHTKGGQRKSQNVRTCYEQLSPTTVQAEKAITRVSFLMHTSCSPPAVDILWANKTSLWLDKNSTQKTDRLLPRSEFTWKQQRTLASPGHQCKFLQQRTREQKHMTWGSSVNMTNDFEEDLCHWYGKSPNKCCKMMTCRAKFIQISSQNPLPHKSSWKVSLMGGVRAWKSQQGKSRKERSSYSWIATGFPASGSFLLLSYMR